MADNVSLGALKATASYLRKAIAIVEPSVMKSDEAPHLALVKEAVEHGEYGLALEDLSAILLDAKIAIPKGAYNALMNAGILMNEGGGGIDEVIWKKLLPMVS